MNEELKITPWKQSLDKQSRCAVLNGKFTMSSLHQEGQHSGQGFSGVWKEIADNIPRLNWWQRVERERNDHTSRKSKRREERHGLLLMFTVL